MTRKRMALDLNDVDWAEVGEKVGEVIATINANKVRFERAAAARGARLEQITAAAITEMVKEFLENQAGA